MLFVDVDAGLVNGGPQGLGVPISIFGHGFGATRGNSRVTIGGVEVASYLVWGAGNAQNPTLDMIAVQPGAATTGGPSLSIQSDNANCRNDCQWYATAHLQTAGGVASLHIDGNAYGPGTPVKVGAADARAVTGANAFADAARFDFRLLAGSSAIDRGTDLGLVAADYWGVARPQGLAPGIGAFETVAGYGAQPAPPSDLRITITAD